VTIQVRVLGPNNIPAGGFAGQHLAKSTDADFDVIWVDGGDGGGGGTTNHAALYNRDAIDQHPISAITGLQNALNQKSATSHSHPQYLTDAPSDNKQYARFNGIWSEVVATGGTGTTDHTQLSNRDAIDQHPISAITDLTNQLANKAGLSHSHTMGEVTSLLPALDTKADSVHTHAISDTTGLQSVLDGKSGISHNHDADYAGIAHNHDADYAPLTHNHDADYSALVHTHAVGDVTGLQSDLDAKAAAVHTHDDLYYTEAEVDIALGLKSDAGHTHLAAEVTDLDLSGYLTAASHAAIDHTGIPGVGSGGGATVYSAPLESPPIAASGLWRIT
jgi:hypothetical protein